MTADTWIPLSEAIRAVLTNLTRRMTNVIRAQAPA